jgi:ferredoxin
VKVVIDTDRCSGHGRCYDLAPDVFYDDEYGYGQVRDIQLTEGHEAAARRAAASCPEHAIEVT